MKKRILTLVILMATLFVAKAEGEYFYLSYVYYSSTKSEREVIPLATVKYYDYDNPTKLMAVRITDFSGRYILRGLDVDKKYIVKVKAPNVKEQAFVTIPNKGKFPPGNLGTSTKLKVPADYQPMLSAKTYQPADFKNLTVEQMINALPNVNVTEEGEILTDEDGAVKIMFNGFYNNKVVQIYPKVKDLPAEKVIKTLDLYNLSKQEGTAYDAVINIHVTFDEKEAKKPNCKLGCLPQYNK